MGQEVVIRIGEGEGGGFRETSRETPDLAPFEIVPSQNSTRVARLSLTGNASLGSVGALVHILDARSAFCYL